MWFVKVCFLFSVLVGGGFIYWFGRTGVLGVLLGLGGLEISELFI